MADGLNFEEIYQEYKQMVYLLALKIVPISEDAEEITQDTFVKVYASLQNFKGNSSLKTWIFRIATNVALSHLQAKKRKKRFAFWVSYDEPTSGGLKREFMDFVNPEKHFESQERLKSIYHEIDQLPPKQKIALIYYKLEQMPIAEVAEMIGISVKGVETLVFRAKKTLGDRLTPLKEK